MKSQIPSFQVSALQSELERLRRERGLSWPELTAEINAPFAHTDSIPISLGTLRGMATKRSVTSGVVLQVLRWMKRPPETFAKPAPKFAPKDMELPSIADHEILRFNTKAIYLALDQERRERQMTWKLVADEIPGFSAGMLTNLAKGPLIGFPRVMTLTGWLQKPAASFMRGTRR